MTNTCRLCGEEKINPLSIELSDMKTSSNWIYRDLVEHHTRVSLKSNKLLPQSVCESCTAIVDSFAEFSQLVQTVQDTFSIGDEIETTVTECFELQLIPETVFKEQEESAQSSSGSESESEKDESFSNNEKTKDKNKENQDSLNYYEIFKKELSKTSLTEFDLHLDVPESAKLGEGEVPESALVHLSPIRWSNLVKNCEACNVPVKNLVEFNSHQESNHNTKTAEIACTECPNRFKKIYSFINHILNKHLHLEHLRYCCLICDLMFYNLAPLFHHVQNYHQADTRRVFQCIICGHHSESLSILKKHKKTHEYDEEAEDLAKIYGNINDSDNEKLTLAVEERFRNEDGTVTAEHEGNFRKWSEFRIDCYMCQAVNMTPIDYYQHHITHHVDWTVYGKTPAAHKFNCVECHEESFASLVAFTSHLIYKHNNEELSFRCVVCSKMFWNYVALSHHIRHFHPSFRHFMCSTCGKVVDRFSNFKQHLTSVHGTSESKVTIKRRNKREHKVKTKLTKRVKVEKYMKDESDSESEVEESESDYDSSISSDDIPLKQKVKEKKSKLKKVEPPKKRRPNNRHRTEKQTIYGPELDTPEKLYADEIRNQSRFSASLHLNITVTMQLPNGEVSEELANSQNLSPLRWRDFLVCAICKVKFTNINALTHHITQDHSTRTRAFGCYNCDIEYGALYESSLVNHLVERHYHEHLRFCCLVCSKLFYDFLALYHHYKTHKGDFEVHVCFICGFYAKTLDDLKEHKAYHVQIENTKPDNQILCEKVLEKFNKGDEPNTFNQEVAEYDRHHDGTVTLECQQRFVVDWTFAQYQCPLCLVNFPNPFELFSHLRLKHPKEQEQARRIYSCNTCVEKKVFSGMHYFINHASEFHFESLRYTCVVCSRMFWNYVALANHYKNVHPSFTSVFCCHCGKLFHSITSAAIHYKKIMIMLTDEEKKLKKEGKLENEEANHICHVCGKCCKNNYTLVKHITTHEEPDPSKMLQCHICSKLFNTKNKLAQHMVGHNNLRKWKCKTCGMSFNFKKLLQMHTRAVHDNERSFACTFCDKKFFKKYDLTVHQRLHTGDFPYVCPVTDCDAKYPAWSNLFKHCQSRHKLDIRSEGYKKLRASEKTTQNDEYGSD